MNDLHAAIMNLPCKYEAAWQTPAPSDWIEGYVNGHRDARHAAAELVAALNAAQAAKESRADARMAPADAYPVDAMCSTCGKTWGAHIGRCCDPDARTPDRRFALAAVATASREPKDQT